jgi:hypothetical protein
MKMGLVKKKDITPIKPNLENEVKVKISKPRKPKPVEKLPRKKEVEDVEEIEYDEDINEIEEVEEKPVKKKKVEVKEELPPVEVKKEEKKYNGIGLIGTHEEISKFKAALKMMNKPIGKALVFMCKAYNEGRIHINL